MKITKDMTKASYSAGKDVFEKKMSRQHAIDYLNSEVGMSRGSAGDFITNFKHLVDGRKYTRTMNEVSTDYFLKTIWNDFNTKIYKNAINAASLHVNYYEKLPKGGKLHGIRRIVDKHSKILKSITNGEYFLEDSSEYEYQREVWKNRHSELPDIPQKKKQATNVNGNLLYPRNPAHAKKSIREANYSCEISTEHKTFIQKFNLKPYTEAHHLIPLKYHSDYPASLDVPANIISLCPSCHRKMHFGQLDEVELLLKSLWEKRAKRISECGLEVSMRKLKMHYKY